MGRGAHQNLKLPKGMRARKRTRKNGRIVIYYFYEVWSGDKRREISLGKDYVVAVQEWAKHEAREIRSENNAILGIAAEKYVQDIISHRASNTQIVVKYNIKRLIEFFGYDAPLDKIEPKHIKQYLDWRKNTPISANTDIGFFSAIFNHARELGYTDKANPCVGVKKNPKKRREVYIENHLYNLVYQAADQKMRDLMDMAYLTGQRPVDIVKIHTRHIYDGILHITQQKTKVKLRIAISDAMMEIIDRNASKNGGYIFRSKQNRPLNRGVLTRWFADLRAELILKNPEMEDDLKNFQFRDLRAKAATDIYLAQNSIAAKEQLGHKSERMTQTYIRKGKTIEPLLKPICGTLSESAEH